MRLRHVLAATLLAGALPAFGQGLNLVTSVSVKDEGGTVVLQVSGTKPPNFTTFSMADPPRFVLDLSEAKFQGVPEDMPVNDGTILIVKNLSYGSDQTSIARIMVAFAVDVEPPDVQTQGSTLIVRVVKPAGAGAGQQAVAQAEAAPAGGQAAAAAAAAAAAEAQARADAQARAEAEAQARAAADRKAQQEAAAREQERLAAEAKEREAREAAQAAAAAAAAPAPGADGQGKADVEAELRALEKEQADAQAKLTAAQAPQQPAETAVPAAGAGDRDEARKAQEDLERQRLDAVAAAKAEAERKKQEAAEKKAEAKRQREEALAAKKAEAQRKKDEALARKADAKRQREEAVAAAKAEADLKKQEALERKAEAKRARDESLAATAPSSVRELGFKQLPGASRVFLRTSAPPRFTIQDVGENHIRVEVENARVANRNFLRFLDTSFFPSAVALITPSRRGSSYVVDIKLKQKVPYQQKIEGDMLAIDFERPPGAAAEAATPGAAGEPAGMAGEPAADAALGAEPLADPAPVEPGPARNAVPARP